MLHRPATRAHLEKARDLLEAVGTALDDEEGEAWEAIDNAWQGLTDQRPNTTPPVASRPQAAVSPPKIETPPKAGSPWARAGAQTAPKTRKSMWSLETDPAVDAEDPDGIFETAENLDDVLRERRKTLPFEPEGQHSRTPQSHSRAPALPSDPEPDFTGTVTIENRRVRHKSLPFDSEADD